MKIGIASDHRGYDLKQKIIKDMKNIEFVDFGTDSDKSVDYPDYAFKLCTGIINKKVDLGIAICGSGIGISIACNKVKGIRCAKIDNMQEAQSAKEHNNANILAFSATSHTAPQIKEMIEKFINSTFNLEPRYKIRIEQVEKYEETNEY